MAKKINPYEQIFLSIILGLILAIFAFFNGDSFLLWWLISGIFIWIILPPLYLLEAKLKEVNLKAVENQQRVEKILQDQMARQQEQESSEQGELSQPQPQPQSISTQPTPTEPAFKHCNYCQGVNRYEVIECVNCGSSQFSLSSE